MKITLFISLLIMFLVAAATVAATTDTISWWCSQTPHHQTCYHYVRQHNFTTTTRNLSTTEFLEVTVRAAIDHARVVHKQAHEIEATHPDALRKGVWSSCVEYFGRIMSTLNMILDHTLQPTQLDVQTWLSAGLAYIGACEKGFELINSTNTMLPIISSNLTELILNALAISVKGSKAPGVVDWDFHNEYKLSGLAVDRPNVVVAQDGSGNFKTIQEAVNLAKNGTQAQRYVIYVKAGIYSEYVVVPASLWYIKMSGAGINKTIVTGDRHLGGRKIEKVLAGDLKNTATFQAWGYGFIAQDITFRNTAGPRGNQSVAFLSGSDRSVFYHCSFEGYQDTLFAISNRQFYKECQIFGTIDFIFGDALVVFQDCEILVRKPLPGQGLVVTAQGRMHPEEVTGFSLQGCKITASSDMKPVIGQYNKVFLGRPWHPSALTVYMESFLDDLVDPKGWVDSWGYKKTATCEEYKNYGPGSSTANRVKWPGYRAITDPKTAESYTVTKFLLGNQWLPETGVPYTPGFEKQ